MTYLKGYILMNIVIVGAGTVGSSICAQLTNENHDLTVVDKHDHVLSELTNLVDVASVVGNGADVSVLRKAGADRADLLIAVTSSDEINILCCAAAKKLGTAHTIARVRNPEYSGLMSIMQREMNLSLTINPELSVAKEIYRMLKFPSAAQIDTFAKGRVELVQFSVTKSSPICDKTLNELRSKLSIHFLVCAVLRAGTVYIPSGHFTVMEGDTLCITAPEREITKFFKATDMYKHPVKNVVIAGAGRIAYYLQALMNDGKIQSTVIDKNREKCEELAKDYHCSVICNDATKKEVLLENGVDKTDAFIALSDSDEENAIVSMSAKAICKSDSRIITMIKTPTYVELFQNLGLDGIISPKTSTSNNILRYVRAMSSAHGSKIQSLHKLMDSRLEALEFIVEKDIEGITNIPLKDLGVREGVLVACIIHNDRIIIPSGASLIQKGDTVIIVSSTQQINGLEEILK